LPTIFPSRVLVLSSDESYLATIRQEYLGTPQCQRSPQTGQPGSNQTSQSIFVSSHFHSKKLPVTLCYGAFWNENAYFVYANSVAGSIRPFVAGFQVTGDIHRAVEDADRSSKKHGMEAIAAAIAAGRQLIEVKKLVRHGNWLKWLEDNCKGIARAPPRQVAGVGGEPVKQGWNNP
jgi:hypothetical protein